MKTSKDHAEGKPSFETLNEAKVKIRDSLPGLTFYIWNVSEDCL